MNILLLSQFFSTTRGGGEYVFSLIAKMFAENNHKVWVLTNKIEGENYEFKKNIELVFVPPPIEYKGGLPPTFSENLRYLVNAIKVGKGLIKKEKIDIIHSNNFTPALAGSILAFLTSKPHITAVWDIFTLCGKNYWKNWVEQSNVSKIHGVLGPRFEKLILKVPSNAIHTISEATNNDLIKFGAKKPIYVIEPSIESNFPVKKEPNPFQFIYIGRLVFYKNLEVLIKAVNIVKKTEPRIKLIIIGGGPHENVIRDLIKQLHLESNIELSGYVNTEEKFEQISKSNALVFPSLCEGFGLVILEAFSQNKPALVSNIKPMSDIVSDNETGFVIDPHREDQWASQMLLLINNPEISIKMGKSANELLKHNYNQQKMYEKILQMYENFIKLE